MGRFSWVKYVISGVLVASTLAGVTLPERASAIGTQFQEPVTYPTASSPNSLVAADFDGDSHQDVASLNGGNSVTVYYGSSAGRLSNRHDYDIVFAGDDILAADVDNDGHTDLVMSAFGQNSQVGGPRMGYLHNDGTGQFEAVQIIPTVDYQSGIASADFNEDGNVDVVLGSNAANSANVMWGTGSGFTGPTLIQSGQPANVFDVRPFNVNTADLNEDNHMDVLYGNYIGGISHGEYMIAAQFGNGDGSFSELTPLLSDAGNQNYYSYHPEVSDVNNDTHLDFVVGSSAGTIIGLGNGDGTFTTSVAPQYSGGSITTLALTDYNLDGNPDIVGSSDGYATFDGHGDGTFTESGSGWQTQLSTVIPAFMDTDNLPDIIGAHYSPNTGAVELAVILNAGSRPILSPIQVVSAQPALISSPFQASIAFTDTNTQPHTAVWNWGDGNTSAGTISQTGTSGTVSGQHTYAKAGWYTISVVVTNSRLASDRQEVYNGVTIYEPGNKAKFSGSKSFETPAHTFPDDQYNNYAADFKFDYEYSGNQPSAKKALRLDVDAKNFHFQATSVSSLMIAEYPAYSNGTADVHGTGTINGAGNYDFWMIGRADYDTLAIYIYDTSTGQKVFDSHYGMPEWHNPLSTISKGKIVVKTP